MIQDPQNRRKYLRFPTDALIWWNNDWEPEPITLLDISAGGMLCEYPREVDDGQEVSLHIEFPGHDGLIYCRAKVVHCRPGEHTYFLVGLHIHDVEGMTMDQFMDRLKNGLSVQSNG